MRERERERERVREQQREETTPKPVRICVDHKDFACFFFTMRTAAHSPEISSERVQHLTLFYSGGRAKI